MSLLGIIASGISGNLTPTSPVAGYTAWYDASDTATITLSGSDVTQWNDKSANGYNLAQPSSGFRPQSGTRTINSLNVIDYNSNTDTLVASTAANWTFLHNSTGSTMFMMLSVDAQPVGDPFVFLRTSGGSTNSNGYVGNVNTSNQWLHAVSASGVGNLLVNTATTLALTTSTATIITVKSDPSNATAANRSYIYKNSSSPNQNNTTTGTPSESAPTQPLRVGDYEEAGTLGINGVIGEIIFYNSKLSDGDIALNVSYLSNKWGI
jgi:hypothetical protein